MKKIVKFAVDYPVSISMIILAILLLGKISYDRLGVDLLPTLSTGELYIELTTTEKPPSEVEKQFVERIEGTAIRTRGAKSVTSKVRTSGALITVEYQWGKDMNEAMLDLQQAVASYSQDEDVEDISVTQIDPSSDPIMLLSLSHDDMTSVELTKIAENYLRPKLLSIEGIANVEFSGDQTQEVVVETDPYKLASFSLTASSIASTIEANNYRVSGGRVEELGKRYIVSGSNLLENIEEFNSIIVGYKDRAYDSDQVSEDNRISADKGAIFLSDVATVELRQKDSESLVRYNGKESLGVKIYKERDFNTLKATNLLLSNVANIRRSMPQYDLEVVTNQGDFIDSSIGEVKNSAMMGMLLAVIVLFVFLRRVGTTIVVSLAIPISIIATFNMFYFGGLTLNIMTLGGLALGAGMLVDNAIVVIESIFRKQEEGLALRDAIIDGTGEVGGAIIASTLTTIVVFFPIVYLQGESGELFKEQAWSVTFALISSLFVAILAIPVMYSKINSGGKSKNREKKGGNSIKIGGYGKFLKEVLRYRYVTVLIAAAFVAVVFMFASSMGSELMPKAGSKSFDIEIEVVGGSTLETTSSTVANIEDVIMQLAEDSVTIYTHCGVAGSDGGDTPLSNRAEMKVVIDKNSTVDSEYLVEQLQSYMNSVNGLETTITNSDNATTSLFKESGGDIIVEIKGEELDELAQLQDVVVDKLQGIEGITAINCEDNTGEQEVVVKVDRVVSSIYGITIQNVISSLSQQLQGVEAGEMTLSGEACAINVKLPEIALVDLQNIEIVANDKRITVGEIATIEYQDAPNVILRRGQSRIVEVALICDSPIPLSKVADNVREVINEIDTPNNYRISIEGSEQNRIDSFNSMVFALVLSIILVYMVMASQFESLLHPFTILLTIPLAVAGALLLFIITGSTLNIMAAIGIVMLVGIAVNSSILLVDRIGQLIENGMTLVDAIVGAAQQRIRPILMTSATTILALLPMALSIGDGSEFQTPMAIAVIGGLVASTLLSLIVIPCFYYILESAKRSLMGRREDDSI